MRRSTIRRISLGLTTVSDAGVSDTNLAHRSDHLITRRCVLRRLAALGSVAGFGLSRFSRSMAARSFAPVESDLTAMTLEQKVGQLVIARLPDWELMEKYVAEGLISGMTPSLKSRTHA